MSGFTDMFGDTATQPISSFDLGNGIQKGNTTVTKAKQPVVAKSSGGGLGGLLYNNFVQPTANAIASLPQDFYNTGEAVKVAGKSVLSGEKGKDLNYSKQRALDLLRDTTIGQGLPDTVEGVKNQSLPKELEQIAGNTGSQALDIAAPVLGAEEFAGKMGIKALAGTGAKVGAKYGLLGGVAGAASQGGDGGELAQGALTGGLEGGALGAAGGGLAGVLGKVAGKVTNRGPAVADEAGAGASAAIGNQVGSGGIAPKLAAKAGGRAAQNVEAQQSIDFTGTTPTERADITGRDKQGNAVGLRQVSSFLRGLDMPAHAQNMRNSHDFMTGVIGGNLQDMTEGVAVNVGSPADVGRSFIVSNTGTLGNLSKSGAGAAGATLRQIRSITDPLMNTDRPPAVTDVLKAISDLEGVKSHLAGDTNAAAKTQAAAYQAVIDHLNKALDSAGVNEAVKGFKVHPELEKTIHDNAVDSGVSPKMARHTIDTLNNGSSYSDLRSAMQPAVIGGHLADLAERKFASSLPEGSPDKVGGNIPSWELAMAMHNPAYLTAAAGRLATHSGIADKVMSKVNPGAFNAAREAALAPDAATARKLEMPGGGPATGAPGEVPASSAPRPAGAVSSALSRITGAVNPTAIGGGALAQGANQLGQQGGLPTAPPTADIATPDATDIGGVPPDTTEPNLDPSTIPGGTIQDLEAEIQADPKNATIYKQIYDEIQKQAASTKLSASQQKSLLAIKQARTTLDQIKREFQAAGGGQGHIGGTVSHLLGNLNMNSQVGIYNDQAVVLGATLYKALGNTGTITDRDQAMIKSLIPNITDSKDKADGKIAGLERLLQEATDNASVATDQPTTDSSSTNLTGGTQ